MRIGIDTRTILDETSARPKAGVAHYVYHLVKALQKIDHENEYVLLSPDRGLPFFGSHTLFANKIRKAELDVFHGPANSLPMGVRGRRGLKLILTIHDLAIYKHPEWFPRGQWFSTKIVVPQSIKKADHIIVPSEATARDLIELFHIPSSKIAVIPLGVEPRFFESGNSKFSPFGRSLRQIPNSKYILFVGTIEPRKNLPRLLEAYRGLSEDILAQYDLVIAGAKGWGTPTSSQEGVKFLGYVPEDQLPGLYQHAAVFVYPSLYEGFGLPVLEAMAAGVPVVTSHQVARNIEYRISNMGPDSTFQIPHSNQSFPGIVVDPRSVEDIKGAIVKFLSPPREYARRFDQAQGDLESNRNGRGTLSSSGESSKDASHSREDSAYASQISRAGRDRARQFTWEKTARQTLEIYRNL